MRSFDVADYTEQGVKLDVIFMGSSFGRFSVDVERQAWLLLQTCATRAGLKGTVVLVWLTDSGQMGYLAPTNWQPYFSSVSLDDLQAKVNEKLTCSTP